MPPRQPLGRRPTTAELEQYLDATVPDLLPDPLRLLFVGINPSLWTAATGAHFARPGNRFYAALAAAGILDHVVDAAAGYDPADLEQLRAAGVGITNLVRRASARADELTADELRAGGERLRETVREHRPRVVAVAGITAYRLAFGRRQAQVGRQPEGLEGAELYVVPNPSGLNAHESVASLGAAYREAAIAAGVMPASG